MFIKLFGGLLITGYLIGQTTANPQFSVVGDLVMGQQSEKTELSSSGLEIAVQGYVNPFARADVFLHKHNDESQVELEEAVITIEQGLPFGLGLRAGKLRPDLGKINKIHAHLFPFIDAPDAMAEILGHEFWAATGLEGSVLLPLPWYSKLSVGYFDRGIGDHAHEEGEINGQDEPSHRINDGLDEHLDHESDEESHTDERAISGRWSHFFDLNEITHLEWGISGYKQGKNDLTGADFKFRWRPNKYRSITIQGEWFQRDVPHDHVHVDEHPDEVQNAAYGLVNFQFNKSWNVGVVADYLKSNLENESKVNPAVFFGFSPVEESAVFRIKIGQDTHEEKSTWYTKAQLIWSLGPHKPHRY